ncbi:hypothetical protein [Ruminococcus sp.]|uniref:hypothetical protein n=1 Tax=Ruminococcus sp. TaxID=41978 RepID=UPI0025FFC734|nr:hypothetical protein [Ruminococcus sp.]
MDDMLGKMGAILSDPESLQQLQELAQMLQQDGESDGSQENAPSEEKNHSDSESSDSGDKGGFDFSMLLRVQELMGAMQNNDDDTKLLLALRPHLKEQRQKKVDQAVKMLKLYAVFSAVKENGLLQDLL